MKQFRLLRADEIECRISTCNEKGVSILLYKTARTDADLLDETVGPAYWENDFKLIDDVLYGGIGVDFDKSGKMIWKWDAGTESNTEAEKGRASDAFKRAGFKHGIGRELYSAPFIWVPADKCRTLRKNDKGKWVCYDNFEVAEIGYDAQERIERLSVTLKGYPVYTLGKTSGTSLSAENRPQTSRDEHKSVQPIMCEHCLGDITDYTYGGVTTPALTIAQESYNKTGKYLCAKCWIKESKKNAG